MPDFGEPTLHQREAEARAEAAYRELGRVLYDELDRLDPMDSEPWDDLTEHQKSIYIWTCRALLKRTGSLLAARPDLANSNHCIKFISNERGK